MLRRRVADELYGGGRVFVMSMPGIRALRRRWMWADATRSLRLLLPVLIVVFRIVHEQWPGHLLFSLLFALGPNANTNVQRVMSYIPL